MNRNVQVFPGRNVKPLSGQNLTVDKIKFLGEGAQGEVYSTMINLGQTLSSRPIYADKTCTVVDNDELMKEALRTFVGEFFVARDLIHPNIIEFKYLIRRYEIKSKTHELHLIMEILDGGNLQ